MNKNAAYLTLIIVGLYAPPGSAASMILDKDGVAVVDGARTFILGLYENPADDDVLQGAVKAGINLVHAGASLEALDRLEKAGAWAWLNTGDTIDLSADTAKRGERLAAMAREYGSHPALLVWEVPDEALWNAWYLAEGWRNDEEPRQLREHIAALGDGDMKKKLTVEVAKLGPLYRLGKYAEGEAIADSIWTALGKEIPKPGYGLSTAPERAREMGDGMLAGYQQLRALDKAHPIWMNHAPRNTVPDLAFFNRAADIVGCDIYPVPEDLHVKHSDLGNRTISSVGAYTKRMQAAAPGKPVWMVLQGTGWGDFQEEKEGREPLRRPTKEETRYMAYDAIVHGARGILYWGSHYVEKDSAFWRELLEVTAELDSLQAVLAAPDAPTQPQVTLGPTHGSLDQGVDVLAKSRQEGDWLLLVNTWSGPLKATVGNLAPQNVSAYRVVGEQERFVVENGAFSVHMPRYSALVLEPVSEK